MFQPVAQDSLQFWSTGCFLLKINSSDPGGSTGDSFWVDVERSSDRAQFFLDPVFYLASQVVRTAGLLAIKRFKTFQTIALYWFKSLIKAAPNELQAIRDRAIQQAYVSTHPLTFPQR